MILALTIAILLAGGVYLVLQRGMLRIVIGMTLMSHAVNLIILAAGSPKWRGDPFPNITDRADAADPLPQAFVLTAIVIAMATTTYMLALAALGRSDDTHAEEVANDNAPMHTLGRSTHYSELVEDLDHDRQRAARLGNHKQHGRDAHDKNDPHSEEAQH